MIQTLITAAKDSRPLFYAAGFGKPKSLVKWDGREVLLRSMDSYVADPYACWVAVNAEEDRDWDLSGKIYENFPAARVIPIPSGVKGALASALLAMAEVAPDEPLVVAAGDSMLQGGVAKHIQQFIANGSDAGTIAFPSTSPRWSYLSVCESAQVRQVAEKRVIGSLATTGVFYFRRADDFYDAATWCLVNNASHDGMYYVSSTLNYMISQSKRVHHLTVPSARYRSWSLPIDFSAQSE